MSLATFTLLHVAISLVGIATGLVALLGLIGGRSLERWTAVFLSTTVLTSLTGYAFPFHGVTPGHIVGAISLVVLAVALLARYRFGLSGSWRTVYVITSTVALYLNVFVGVVQAFQKVPALNAMAPTQSEPPFAVAQSLVLLTFALLGFQAARRFRSRAASAAAV